MERRRAIAWAGSIAATGCAGTLALGALVGGFGLGPGPAGGGQVASPGPVPGVPEPGPIPGVTEPGPVPGVIEPGPVPEVPQPGPVPEVPEPLPVLGNAPAAGRDPRSPTGGDMRLLAGPTPAPSVDTGEVPSHEAKVRALPEPTTRSSPQREPAATASEVDTSKQGRDTRGRGQRQPATTASEADAGKQGRDAEGFDRREPTTMSSAANIPELVVPQSKAPAGDQPPDRSAKPTKTKENHAVTGEDGGGG